jgi:hypothetical protein
MGVLGCGLTLDRGCIMRRLATLAVVVYEAHRSRTHGGFNVMVKSGAYLNLGLILLLHISASQVNGQFNTVINVPPDPPPQSIGSDTQLNVLEGGVLPSSSNAPFQAGDPNGSSTNVEVNVTGGSIGDFFRANGGSQVNIAGGVAGSIHANDGSTVNFSGGTLGDNFYADDGSVVNLSGNDFRLDGTPFSGLAIGDTVTLDHPYGILDGVFEDGTPFALVLINWHYWNVDEVRGALTLQAASLPPVGPTLITASSDPVPLGIRRGQTLLVDNGGIVRDNFNAAPGSTVSVEGGTVGKNFEIIGATVNISSGEVGDRLEAFDGSQVNISGGSVGHFFRMLGGTTNISGGSIGGEFYVQGGTATVSGGSFGDSFYSSRPFDIFGSEFYLDGELVDGLQNVGDSVTILQFAEEYSTVTGILADGTPFAFSYSDFDLTSLSDFIPPGITPGVTLHVAEPPPPGPALIIASIDPIPAGIRRGQTLVVDSGGVVGDNFTAIQGSTVIIEEGAVVGDNLEVVDATVMISGGSIGDGFDAFPESVVEISGGSLGGQFDAYEGSQVNLLGTDFFLDGVELTDLIPGEATQISERNVMLSGVLADGSLFSFDLNSENYWGDFFDHNATLTVTLSTGDAPVGDVNLDGVVNGLDVDPFVEVLLSGPYQPEADMNEDGDVNGLDVDAFVAAVVGGAQPVPEPSTLLLGAIALGVIGGWRKWKRAA